MLLSTILFASIIWVAFLPFTPTSKSEVFFGVDIGYGDEETAISLVDEVASYVNLIILGSLDVTIDTEALTRVCDHIFEKGLHFIVFVAFAKEGYVPPQGPDPQFFMRAIDRWGDKFLGVYIFDEAGGKLIDGEIYQSLVFAQSYSEAAIIHTHHLNYFIGNTTDYYAPAEFKVFTSDYALYWYDYIAGYDVVFTEFVGNNSRAIAAGLCRGAAKTLNKEWGVIITWTQTPDFFVQNPDQIYVDMVIAYENGAKYIVVFNSPGNFTAPSEYGILTPQHLEKMRDFWNYLNTQQSVGNFPANKAYVLPRDYGFGFRGPEDKIWGKWEADSLSAKVWNDVNQLFQTNTVYLDIIYETQIADTPIILPYEELIFWNGTQRPS